MRSPTIRIALAAGLALIAPGALAKPAASGGLVLERAVVLIRHGVRAPLNGEVPDDTRTAQGWPRWPVAPGELTPHGAAAIERQARADRRRFAALGLPACPASGDVTIRTNSEQRTIATGEAYARGFAPGCRLEIEHEARGVTDPMFAPLGSGITAFDGDKAVAAIDAYTGGMEALVARHRGDIALLDRVLACRTPPCSPVVPARVTPSADGRGLDLTGPIRKTSGIAQVLLLEQAEGLPAREVGWGRADAATIQRLGALHAALFDVFTRSPYMAAHQSSLLGGRILATLTEAKAPRLDVLVGHDTNVTALAGALQVDLVAPGYARNDVAPGGSLVFERLRDPRTGARFVRVAYRAQPLGVIRAGGDTVAEQPLAIKGCGGDPCPLDRFVALLRSRIAPPLVH